VRRIEGQPQIIVAHTLKGKGLSPFEQDEVSRRHGEPLKPQEVPVALAELDEMRYTVAFAGREPELTRQDVQGDQEL